MYAPKFRSWLTDEQRFSEALSYKLDLMASEALKEIHDMAEAAKPQEPKPVVDSAMEPQEILNALRNSQLNQYYSHLLPNDLCINPMGMMQAGNSPAGFSLIDSILGSGNNQLFGY